MKRLPHGPEISHNIKSVVTIETLMMTEHPLEYD